MVTYGGTTPINTLARGGGSGNTMVGMVLRGENGDPCHHSNRTVRRLEHSAGRRVGTSMVIGPRNMRLGLWCCDCTGCGDRVRLGMTSEHQNLISGIPFMQCITPYVPLETLMFSAMVYKYLAIPPRPVPCVSCPSAYVYCRSSLYYSQSSRLNRHRPVESSQWSRIT